MADLIGKSFGRYHILEQLGEGGMATVYKAFDTRLEADVAVKVIRTENILPSVLDRALKRFEREAKSLARLTHPNIVKVTDYGEEDGKPYLVMPYLPGGTLKQRMGKPIPWQEAVQLLLPIVEALDYAHSQNMIHRDVKPSNILLTDRGQPMLTDFGIAKILDMEATIDLTGTSTAVGTPEYMAPEQATAKTADHRADIYALGIVLYEMVTGRKPFVADTPLAVLFKHVSDPLPSPTKYVPDLPVEVEKVLVKALAKKPEDRYQNMAEMSKGFGRLMETGGRTKKGATQATVHDERISKSASGGQPDALPPSVKIMGIMGMIIFFVALTVWGFSKMMTGRGGLPVTEPIVPTSPYLTVTPKTSFTATTSAPFPYVIQEGDSLESIAQKFNLGEDGSLIIYYANQVAMDANGGMIFVGQTIMIPQPGTLIPTTTPVPADIPGGTIVEYRIQPGDTLPGIAVKFNTLLESIVYENNIQDANALQVGQILRIPVNLASSGPTQTQGLSEPTSTMVPQFTLTDFTVRNETAGSLQFSVDYDGSFGEVYVYAGCYSGSYDTPCVVMDVSPYGAVSGNTTLIITLGMYGPNPITTDSIYVLVSPTNGSSGFQWIFEYPKAWTVLLPTPTLVQ